MRIHILSALFLLGSLGARAAPVTYSYVSDPFDSFHNTACPPTCNITGSFTVVTAFSPNQSQDIGGSGSFTPLSFSFTDGQLTWTNTNTVDSGFNFDTDSLGNITFYSFYADTADGSDISAFYDGPSNLTQLFASDHGIDSSASLSTPGTSHGGVWTSSVSSVPEPSSEILFAAGLLGFAAFWALRRARELVTTAEQVSARQNGGSTQKWLRQMKVDLLSRTKFRIRVHVDSTATTRASSAVRPALSSILFERQERTSRG